MGRVNAGFIASFFMPKHVREVASGKFSYMRLERSDYSASLSRSLPLRSASVIPFTDDA